MLGLYSLKWQRLKMTRRPRARRSRSNSSTIGSVSWGSQRGCQSHMLTVHTGFRECCPYHQHSSKSPTPQPPARKTSIYYLFLYIQTLFIAEIAFLFSICFNLNVNHNFVKRQSQQRHQGSEHKASVSEEPASISRNKPCLETLLLI